MIMRLIVISIKTLHFIQFYVRLCANISIQLYYIDKYLKVIYEQNSDDKTLIASLTKIMTDIVDIENNDNLG